MIAIWCFISYKLIRTPILVKVLENNCHIIVPIVLIGLGMFILFAVIQLNYCTNMLKLELKESNAVKAILQIKCSTVFKILVK